jgi:hypothetical protein
MSEEELSTIYVENELLHSKLKYRETDSDILQTEENLSTIHVEDGLLHSKRKCSETELHLGKKHTESRSFVFTFGNRYSYFYYYVIIYLPFDCLFFWCFES